MIRESKKGYSIKPLRSIRKPCRWRRSVLDVLNDQDCAGPRRAVLDETRVETYVYDRFNSSSLFRSIWPLVCGVDKCINSNVRCSTKVWLQFLQAFMNLDLFLLSTWIFSFTILPVEEPRHGHGNRRGSLAQRSAETRRQHCLRRRGLFAVPFESSTIRKPFVGLRQARVLTKFPRPSPFDRDRPASGAHTKSLIST